MSIAFELDTAGQRSAIQGLQQAAQETPRQVMPEPGLFAGTGGLAMSEMAMAGRSLAIAGAAIPAAIDWVVDDDNMSGKPLVDQYFELIDQPSKDAVEYWKPAPQVTGSVGRVLGPVLGGFVELGAAGGNPALMLTRQSIGTSTELIDQGVDLDTAQTVGAVQGVATAVGFGIGAYGATLTRKMLTGAAGNLATNVPAAAASSAVLQAEGYNEQSERFNPWDAEARAVDVLMGAAIGAVAHFGAKTAETTPAPELPPTVKLTPTEQSALLTAAGAKNWALDTAPGVPASVGDLAKHQGAMSTALDQMMRNEPVSIGGRIDGATFTPRAETPEQAAMAELLREQYPPEQPAPDLVSTLDETGDIQAAVKPLEQPLEVDSVSPKAQEEPEIFAARQALDRQPDTTLINIGDDETPVFASAKDVWKQIENETLQAKQDSNAFMAAVTCFLGG